LWFTASLKFLTPFSVLVTFGSWLSWPTEPSTLPAAVISNLVNQIGQPFTIISGTALPPDTASNTSLFSTVVLTGWTCGFLTSLGCWFIRWWRIRWAIREGRPLLLDTPIKTVACSQQVEPGVFGVFHPVMLMPDGLVDRLSATQFKAVVAHELCHVRRRDN